MRITLSSLFGLCLCAAAAAQGLPLNLAPAKTAPAVAGKPGAARAAPDAQESIQRANAYFNASPTMIADFVQLNASNKRLEGRLYLQRPGKMRFEYAKPATVDVVSDGRSVAIRDSKLKTQDLWAIGQTPLKFLTKERIDLARDSKVLDVRAEGGSVAILIEDKATLGGTSHIKLIFDADSFALKQWAVTDPQGFQTVVSLFNVDFNKKPDPALFKINEERLINTDK